MEGRRSTMRYELFYWPGIQGRGEYIRLALEEAGAEYIDYALIPEEEGGGATAIEALLEAGDQPSFAPPFVRYGRQVVGQTANILAWIGPRLGLAPGGAAQGRWINQLQLTLADFLVEIHDTHHPVGVGLYYDEQRAESLLRAADFRANRLPKYLAYFERLLEQGSGTMLTGSTLSYADLSLAQIMTGLEWAFPKAMRQAERAFPLLHEHARRTFERPRIAAYLHSARRLPFNNDDIFRRYPELDGPLG